MDDAERRLYRVIHVEGDLAQVEMSGHISNTIIKMFFEQGVSGVGGVEREAMMTLFKKSGDTELMENLHLIKDVLQISVSCFKFYFAFCCTLASFIGELLVRKSVFYRSFSICHIFWTKSFPVVELFQYQLRFKYIIFIIFFRDPHIT